MLHKENREKSYFLHCISNRVPTIYTVDILVPGVIGITTHVTDRRNYLSFRSAKGGLNPLFTADLGSGFDTS